MTKEELMRRAINSLPTVYEMGAVHLVLSLPVTAKLLPKEAMV